MLHSIRWRLVLSYTLLTLLTVSLLGILVLSLVQRYIARQENAWLTANASALARQSTGWLQADVPLPRLEQLAQTMALLGNVQVRFLNADKQPLVDSGVPATAKFFTWRAPTGNDGQGLLPDTIILSAAPDPISLGVVQPKIQPSIVEAEAWQAIVVGGASRGLPAGQTNVQDIMILPPPDDLFAPSVQFALQEYTGAYTVAYSAAFTTTLTKGAWNNSIPARANPQFNLAIEPIRSAEGLVGYVEVSSAPSRTSRGLAAIRHMFLLAGALVSSLAVIVGLVVSRGLTAPLASLTRAAQRMNSGDLAARAPVQGNDEIGVLAQRFNEMAGALEKNFAALAAERDALRHFIGDASHELRTPITALRTFYDLLQGTAEEDRAARQEFLREGALQINRLERITAQLLNLSRLEGGVATLQLAEHDLNEVVAAVAAPFKTLAQEKQITLQVALPGQATPTRCDRGQLETAVGNLLENALKFTPAGGQVEVGCGLHGGSTQLWVADHGVGIPADELPHIFERFYRGQGAQQSEGTNGSGLGLAIVQSIVHAHGGSLTVTSAAGRGSRFVIELGKG